MTKTAFLNGDPQTKFLLLFLSAVRHPPFRLTKKNSPDFAPPSNLRHPTWGQSYTVGPNPMFKI